MGQNLPMERCQKLLACGCGVKTSEKILTSFVDDPLLWSALGGRKAKQSRALRGQTNAMHWTNWKGVGNRVARFEESPVVRMKRLLTLNRAGGTLGARGHSPVPDFGRSVNSPSAGSVHYSEYGIHEYAQSNGILH